MRPIPDPGFAGDDGRADPVVASALAAYDLAPADGHHRALAALLGSRVLVPVVAVLGEVEYDEHGLAREKTSDMAAVRLIGADGREALLGFTGTAALRAWDPDARPVPVTLRQAALAAIQDGAEALLLDVAGPVLFVLDGSDLDAVARGLELVRVETGPGQLSWAWGQRVD